MEIIIRNIDREREVRLGITQPETTLADVIVESVGHLPGQHCWVDARLCNVNSTLPAAGLGRGSIVDLAPPELRPTNGRYVLRQIAGPTAGCSVELEAGYYDLGPSRRRGGAGLHDGPTAAAAAMLEIGSDGVQLTTSAPATIDGIPIDGGSAIITPRAVLRLADSAFVIEQLAPDEVPPARPDVQGVILLHRPPRLAAPAAIESVKVPPQPRAPEPPKRLSPIALLAPIPVAIAMAIFLRPLFLLFALSSPIGAIARHWDEKRQFRKFDAEVAAQVDEAFAQLSHDATAANNVERSRRREIDPDIATVLERIHRLDPQLWERRREHADFFRLNLGVANLDWDMPLDARHSPIEGWEDITNPHRMLVDVPVTVELDAVGGVGIHGDRGRSLALARSLVCQLAGNHGPADIEIAVLTSPGRRREWDWVKWLPHGQKGVCHVETRIERLDITIEARLDAAKERPSTWEAEDDPPQPTLVLIVDDVAQLRTRSATARLLGRNQTTDIRAIVVSDAEHELPASCRAMVDTGVGLGARLTLADQRKAVDGILLAPISAVAARTCARSLGRLNDPEKAGAGGSIPRGVALPELLGHDLSVEAIKHAWSTPNFDAPIGADNFGGLTLNVITEGPHGLVAGTTGSGKSELLRTLVAALAVQVSPDDVNFVLIDYKGGGAFDACAQLPHTVAVVTDLDEHLGARALRCLKAELHHREVRLREAGVSDIRDFTPDPANPLPRLLVVIDEFATVAAELPDFMGSLVDIAQRGRSLGIHMILATQRPAGVIDQKIRANTNFRIALRVQSEADSQDVINCRDAAAIDHTLPGRAAMRLGGSPVSLFQTALVTAPLRSDAGPALSIESFAGSISAISKLADDTSDVADGPSVLEYISAATTDAARELRLTQPRIPWPDALPSDQPCEPWAASSASGVCVQEPLVPFALVDLPDEQRQAMQGWRPFTENLLIYGIPGAGTSTLLTTLATSAAWNVPADKLHLHILDCDAGGLLPLAQLPNVGTVARLDDQEQIIRLARSLEIELASRRELVKTHGPRATQAMHGIAVLIDNLASFKDVAEENAHLARALQQLLLVARDGSAFRMTLVVTGKNERSIPHGLASMVPNKIIMRLADPAAYAAFGIRAKDVPQLGPGRAIDPNTGTLMQVARFAAGDVETAVGLCATRPIDPRILPAPIAVLDERIKLETIVAAGSQGDAALQIAVGVETTDLQPVTLTLRPGGHAMVVGPAQSGRSTTLATVAESVHRLDPTMPIQAVVARPSPLSELAWLSVRGVDSLDALADELEASDVHQLLLIDDADQLDSPALERIVKKTSRAISIVIAGNAEALKTIGHWSRDLHRCRAGIMLAPSSADADLLRAAPPRGLSCRTGQGFLVAGGTAQHLQVVVP